MTPPFDPSRRRLLLAGAAVLVAAAGPTTVDALLRIASGPSRSDELRSLVRDRATAIPLGRAYLAMEPGEGSQRTLERLLIDARSGSIARDQVSQRMATDFAAHETVVVDGWVLSRTEARLFAYVALG